MSKFKNLIFDNWWKEEVFQNDHLNAELNIDESVERNCKHSLERVKLKTEYVDGEIKTHFVFITRYGLESLKGYGFDRNWDAESFRITSQANYTIYRTLISWLCKSQIYEGDVVFFEDYVNEMLDIMEKHSDTYGAYYNRILGEGVVTKGQDWLGLFYHMKPTEDFLVNMNILTQKEERLFDGR